MAKSDKVNQAFVLYKTGKKLKDIASELDVAEGTVRSWKNRYEWDSDSVATKIRNVAKKQRNIESMMDDAIKETFQNKELTPQQQIFCAHYIRTFNATQSYIKAFGASYNVANAEGYKTLVKPSIKAEIDRLKEIKQQQIAIAEDDLVEYHMRIAFADMGDYVSFGYHEEDGNVVKLRKSDMVDTQLIQEVKQGQSGVSIKLVDRHKSLEWLDKYFLCNPADRHKLEYDRQKYELELLKLEMQIKDDDVSEQVEDNFLDALNAIAGEVWSDASSE